MYTEKQLNAVAYELRSRVEKATVTDYEVVLVALTMWKGKRINLEQISKLLLIAFSEDRERVLRILDLALNTTSDDLINNIIKDVEK